MDISYEKAREIVLSEYNHAFYYIDIILEDVFNISAFKEDDFFDIKPVTVSFSFTPKGIHSETEVHSFIRNAVPSLTAKFVLNFSYSQYAEEMIYIIECATLLNKSVRLHKPEYIAGLDVKGQLKRVISSPENWRDGNFDLAQAWEQRDIIIERHYNLMQNLLSGYTGEEELEE